MGRHGTPCNATGAPNTAMPRCGARQCHGINSRCRGIARPGAHLCACNVASALQVRCRFAARNVAGHAGAAERFGSSATAPGHRSGISANRRPAGRASPIMIFISWDTGSSLSAWTRLHRKKKGAVADHFRAPRQDRKAGVQNKTGEQTGERNEKSRWSFRSSPGVSFTGSIPVGDQESIVLPAMVWTSESGRTAANGGASSGATTARKSYCRLAPIPKYH